MKKTALLFILMMSYVVIHAQSNTAKPAEGLEIGNQAPEITLNDSAGKSVTLSSLHGKIVLLDFWASWCPPCRRENPNVVAAYKKYKDAKFQTTKGFTIYSVSLDKGKEAWVNAIKQDGLVWPNHVSDLKYWQSDAAKAYQVQAIPTNWLLDENGVIIGKNLHGTDLDNALEKLKAK